MDTGLGGKTVLLTGASGGIGMEIARAFDAENARLVLAYQSGNDRILELCSGVKSPHVTIKGDLTSEEDVDSIFLAAEKEFGRIDVLTSCVGVWSETKSIADRSLAEWRKCLDTNLTANFLLARGFFRNLRKHREAHASIVFIGSSAGCIGEAFHHDYAAAKSAVMFGLIRSLKVEIVDFADHGRVNAVSPGWCATPMSESALRDAKVLNRITSTIPLRKVATPRDVAAAAIFLASDVLAGHVTGEILSVTGGMDGRLLYGELL